MSVFEMVMAAATMVAAVECWWSVHKPQEVQA